MRQKISGMAGFSLIETIVTLSVMSIAGLMLVKTNVGGMKANKYNQLRSDVQDVKRTIVQRVDCKQTFASFGPTRPISCPAGSVINLKDKAGNALITNHKIGDWTIDAECEVIGTRNGLSVYATKQISQGQFKVDPLTNKQLDRNHPISRLFEPDVRLCAEYFDTPNTDGWIAVPPFASFTSVVIPSNYQALWPGSPAVTVRYGTASSAGNFSPSEWCKQKGYNYSIGVCRGTFTNSAGTSQIEGPLIANTVMGNWSYACQYGLPNYFWIDPTTEMQCR